MEYNFAHDYIIRGSQPGPPERIECCCKPTETGVASITSLPAAVLDILSLCRGQPLLFSRQTYLLYGGLWFLLMLLFAGAEMMWFKHADVVVVLSSFLGVVLWLIIASATTHKVCCLLKGQGTYLDSVTVCLWTRGLSLPLLAFSKR